MPGVFRRKEQGPVERTAAADSPGHCVSPATKGESPMNAIAPLGPVVARSGNPRSSMSCGRNGGGLRRREVGG